jgi:preprotein translocase subunit SecE
LSASPPVRATGSPAAARRDRAGGRRDSAQRVTTHPATEEGEVAEKNRRGEEPADDNIDEIFDDNADGDADADGDEPVSRGGGTATQAKPKADADDKSAKEKKDTERVGVFGRLGRFVREVVAELRKVIWPTRKELLTYTAVVIVFLAIMVTLVVGMDYVFAKGVLLVFGNPE